MFIVVVEALSTLLLILVMMLDFSNLSFEAPQINYGFLHFWIQSPSNESINKFDKDYYSLMIFV